MFKGSIVAIVTPFKKGKVDEARLKELVEFQIESGTQGIVPCGTTGESPTLSHVEHARVIELCIEAVRGRVPVIAGTGSNSTAEAIEMTKHALDAGAAGALIVSPYYNKPTQEGLYLHYKAIADKVKIPIIVYNIAGRTAVNIETPTLARLAKDCKNIVGVKEASGNPEQMKAVKKACPKDFILLSGDDAMTLEILKMGGQGVISVAANIIPKEIAKMISLFEEGKTNEAQKMNDTLMPLFKSLFIETNPIPVKEAMGMMELCLPEMRLPLCPMADANRTKLKSVLAEFGLVKGQPAGK